RRLRTAHDVRVDRVARDGRRVDGRFDVGHALDPRDDVDAASAGPAGAGEDLAGDNACGHPPDRLARAGAATALPGADAVLGLVGEVGMRGTKLRLHLLIVPGPHVLVVDQHRQRRSQGQALVHPGQDLDPVGLAALRRDGALAGAAPVQLALDLLDRQRHARRTTVDHDPDGRAVRLTEGRDAEQAAEAVPGHQRPGSTSIMPRWTDSPASMNTRPPPSSICRNRSPAARKRQTSALPADRSGTRPAISTLARPDSRCTYMRSW